MWQALGPVLGALDFSWMKGDAKMFNSFFKFFSTRQGSASITSDISVRKKRKGEKDIGAEAETSTNGSFFWVLSKLAL